MTEPMTWRPDWTVAPGEILLEALQDRHMSQSELARRMGRPTKTINEIIHGKAAITAETAIQLELTLGINASLWNNLETNYREHLARQRSGQELEATAGWAEKFPISDLVRHKLIEPGPTKREAVAALLSYFGVGSPSAWQTHWGVSTAAFRKSRAYASSPEATAAWLRWGEIVARGIETEPFDARQLREVMKEIRGLTRQGDTMRTLDRARALLVTAGVVLVLTPEFAGTRLSGAARWTGADKAVIQLSMRHKSNDHLWFSLFHEAGHLVEGKRGEYIDAVGDALTAGEAEETADRFARDCLIAADAYKRFLSAEAFTEQAVRKFSRDQGIAPGIVVGRLQRDEVVPKSYLNKLKWSVKWPRAP